MADTSSQQCTLRNAEYEDCETATDLLRELGLSIPVGRDEIRYHWRRFWIDNPALAVDGPVPSKGWLLEDSGEIVGFFGNIPLLYDYGGRPVIVAGASKWGVRKKYRTETSRLADAYFNQENADLLLVTTGIKPTGRIFERYGGLPVPQSDYDQVLYWILNARDFLRAGLMKKGFRPELAAAAALSGAPFASVAMTLGGHRPHGHSEDIGTLQIADIGDEFDGLWQKKRNEADRLLACRSAESLRWHFGTERMAVQTRVLVSRDADGLAGYAAIMREDAPEIGLKRLKVIDLFVAGDNEVVIDNLLTAAFEIGRADGCHVLELVGMPATVRDHIVSRHRPHSRKMVTWPVFYKSLHKDLDAPLQDEKSWYVTAYDGDTAIF